jgi:hypothetical protein
LLDLAKLSYTWNILLSILVLAVDLAIANAVAVAVAPAVGRQSADTMFSLLVSKMSILDNFSLF